MLIKTAELAPEQRKKPLVALTRAEFPASSLPPYIQFVGMTFRLVHGSSILLLLPRLEFRLTKEAMQEASPSLLFVPFLSGKIFSPRPLLIVGGEGPVCCPDTLRVG